MTKSEYGFIIRKESAAVNAMQTAGLEGKVIKNPDGGTVYSIPQLGQPLFVEMDHGTMVDCGQVVSCRLCKDANIGKQSVRVSTTVFQEEEFEVYLATGIEMPQLRWPRKYPIIS